MKERESETEEREKYICIYMMLSNNCRFSPFAQHPLAPNLAPRLAPACAAGADVSKVDTANTQRKRETKRDKDKDRQRKRGERGERGER